MNEFSPPEAPPVTSPSQATLPKSQETLGLLHRPLIFGLSLPWIVGLFAVVLAAALYLFWPEQRSAVNQLAFDEVEETSNHSEITPSHQVAEPEPATGIFQVQDQVATMVGGLRSFGQANREAIEKLAESVKGLSASLAATKQDLTEAQAQVVLLSGRLAALEKPRPSSSAKSATARSPAHAVVASPVAGMHLSAIQNGMAWINWQEKTWAVQVGDSLGPVTIVGIDAGARKVRTSAGLLE